MSLNKLAMNIQVSLGLSEEDSKKQYGELKERLALEYPYDIEKYCDGEDEFVKQLKKKALNWRNSNLAIRLN